MTKKRLNKYIDTRSLCGMAILSALSIVSLLFIKFPIFPQVAFLEYDLADVFMLIATFIYGPVYGVALCAVTSVLQCLLLSPNSIPFGMLMHFISTSSCLLTAGIIYGRKKTLSRALIGMGAGVVVWTLIMIPLNLIFIPLQYGASVELVISLLGWIVLFNFIKSFGNCLVTFLIYKRMHKLFIGLTLSAPSDIDIEFDENGKFEFYSKSESDTRRLGTALGKRLTGNETVLLTGELGAGKTVFTKGIADSLGIEDEITSPTFTIVKEYKGLHPLYHFDMYRVTEEECAETGIAEHLNNGVCVIEWNKFSALHGDIYDVEIVYLGASRRRITIRRQAK